MSTMITGRHGNSMVGAVRSNRSLAVSVLPYLVDSTLGTHLQMLREI